MKYLTFFPFLLLSLNSSLNAQAVITKADNTEINASGFTNRDEAKNEIDKNGLKQGKWLEYLKINDNYQYVITTLDSATFYRLVTYKNDNFEGIEKLYKVNGELVYEIKYLNGIGIIKSYHKDGKLSGETQVFNGQPHGFMRLFHENGNLNMERFFINGLSNGLSKSYHKNGKLSFEQTLLNNKLHGSSKFFNEQGQLVSETFFENNIGNGTTKYYDENGNMYSMQYKDDKGNTIFKTFNKNNGNVQSMTVMNGVKVLESKDYYESGQLLSENFYDANGKITKTKNYKERRSLLNEEEKKEYDAKRRQERLEFWNSFTKEVVMVTQQTLAYQNYLNNPNAQTLTNYSKVIINNSTKDGGEAIKDNNTILNSNSAVVSEGVASTNGGSNSSSSQQAAICAKKSKIEWEGSAEYMNYMKNQSCSKLGYIAQRKQAEILRTNCSSVSSTDDLNALNKIISSLTQLINGMPDCSYLQFADPGEKKPVKYETIDSTPKKYNGDGKATKAQ